MLCSNPAATKAVMGGMMVTTRSTVVRALKHIHTAKHTSALHMTPRATAGTNSREVFALAVVKATSPTAPPPNVYWVVQYISTAAEKAPTELPTNATTQL